MTDLERVIKDRLDRECPTRATCRKPTSYAPPALTLARECWECNKHDTLAHLIAEDVKGMVE